MKTIIELLEGVEMPEPVAWQWMGTGHFRKNLPKDAEKYCWRPLYIAPHPAPSTSPPLTPKQRVSIAEASVNFDFDDNFMGDIGKIVDMVEAAHKIGAKP